MKLFSIIIGFFGFSRFHGQKIHNLFLTPIYSPVIIDNEQCSGESEKIMQSF